ncbi:hypothetical protein HPB52_003107 [Rhipicephalus sanguineus]|uniref:Uncharacterized protein n=1 Tax=Rhipicephalus sanguineus TaxID=34632 RepID=A0A9D4QH24_RHISA|nr:hypothetical protein HPB52_003107 [Rhipicephalus sanguineus]
MPEKVSSVLQKGPKLGLEPKVTPHELIAVNRRITRKAEAEQREKRLLEAGDCLLKSGFPKPAHGSNTELVLSTIEWVIIFVIITIILLDSGRAPLAHSNALTDQGTSSLQQPNMDLDELCCIRNRGASSYVTPSRFHKASSSSKSPRHHLRTGCVPSCKAIYESTLVERDHEVKSRKPVEKLPCCPRRSQGCVLFQRDQCGQKFGIAHAPRTQAVGLQAAATSRDGEHVLINRYSLA